MFLYQSLTISKQTKKSVGVPGQIAHNQNLEDAAGVWSKPNQYPVVEINIENDEIIRWECHSYDSEASTQFQAKYKNSRLTATSFEEDFLKITFSIFKLIDSEKKHN